MANKQSKKNVHERKGKPHSRHLFMFLREYFPASVADCGAVSVQAVDIATHPLMAGITLAH